MGQRVGVGRQLQQRGDLGGAGQLGVGDPVVIAVAHQEIGETDETAVEHRGLIHHRGAVGDGAPGRLGGGGQPRECVCRTADYGDPIAELVAQPVEPASLCSLPRVTVRASRSSSADRGTPAEFRVEVPQQRVLAPSRGGQIRRAVDDPFPLVDVGRQRREPGTFGIGGTGRGRRVDPRCTPACGGGNGGAISGSGGAGGGGGIS